MYRFSLFAFAGSLGSVFAFRIDSIMIPKFLSMEDNGTFSIGVTLASALAVPATGIFILYAPIISNYIKNNAIAELDLKYKEISKLLFFIGALLYSCIFLGIENLFLLLPTHENLMASIPVILILGFNVLVNMGTGFNGEIITYSKYYRFNLIAIGILILLNVSLNILFIKVFYFGIEGVAIASLISMLLFNFSKLLFIYQKFRILPFDKSYLKLILVFSLVLFVSANLPNLDTVLWNLIYKTIFCLSTNLLLIYKLKLVFSYNFWVEKTMLKLNTNTYKRRR
jgi:O-antigen/teichoic acid export membrane protein